MNDTIRRLVGNRYERIRTGLCYGFDDGAVLDECKALRGGLWMSSPEGELPYEDSQFEVVVMDGAKISEANAKEAHRVLLPGGCLFFSVSEKTRNQAGYELPDIYKLVRDGFDIVALVRSDGWWRFWSRRNRMLTVCAQRKNWRKKV